MENTKEKLKHLEATSLDEDVNYWLTQWAKWSRKDDHKLGYPKKSVLLSSGGASQRWDDWAESEEQSLHERNCGIMNTLINDLPDLQAAAVRATYLNEKPRKFVVIDNRWRDIPSLLEQAAHSLIVGMRKSGVI